MGELAHVNVDLIAVRVGHTRVAFSSRDVFVDLTPEILTLTFAGIFTNCLFQRAINRTVVANPIDCSVNQLVNILHRSATHSIHCKKRKKQMISALKHRIVLNRNTCQRN